MPEALILYLEINYEGCWIEESEGDRRFGLSFNAVFFIESAVTFKLNTVVQIKICPSAFIVFMQG